MFHDLREERKTFRKKKKETHHGKKFTKLAGMKRYFKTHDHVKYFLCT